MNEVNFLLRNKNKIVTIVLSLFLIGILFVVIRSAAQNNGLLVTPWVGKIVSRSTSLPPTPTPIPVTPAYNPPKEFHYGSATNLKEELDSINPEVLESDFE